jgi:hypothetical protein
MEPRCRCRSSSSRNAATPQQQPTQPLILGTNNTRRTSRSRSVVHTYTLYSRDEFYIQYTTTTTAVYHCSDAIEKQQQPHPHSQTKNEYHNNQYPQTPTGPLRRTRRHPRGHGDNAAQPGIARRRTVPGTQGTPRGDAQDVASNEGL